MFSGFMPLNRLQAAPGCPSPEQQLAEVQEWVTIARVIDGDTVHLTDGRKIRLIGINTPEIGYGGAQSQPFARQARRALVQLVQGHKKIGLSYDQDKKDRYQRFLAYMHLPDGQSIAQSLLIQGLGFSIALPPNIRRINCFRDIESRARKANRGIWQLPQMQAVNAGDLPGKAKGYRFISGTVKSYHESKKSLYLQLTAKLAIRIAKKDRAYFANLKPKSLIGKHVLVRGWVSRYKGRQSIFLRSTHNIQVLAPSNRL